ncbi:MAG: SRPBCC domain-containing protein [Planctomycetota bacterium]
MVAAAERKEPSFRVDREIEIEAPIETAFEALLEQLGSKAVTRDGSPMPMKFEPWPGGRWFRDLGNDAGHWWGTVQVIKPPALIEINGPLFMSYPALSHIQYRLEASDGQTNLLFVHRAIGEIEPDHIEGVSGGWEQMLTLVKARAESSP